jgi:predicted DNA-binding protein (MmcQ/YjbR family)
VKAIFERPVFTRARRLCLALPETTETASWGHPNFRAGGIIFCAFEIIGGRPSIAFKLPPADVVRTLRRKGFFVTPYGRGRWVSRWVDDAVNVKAIAELVVTSYRCVAKKRMLEALPRRRSSNRPSGAAT